MIRMKNEDELEEIFIPRLAFSKRYACHSIAPRKAIRACVPFFETHNMPLELAGF
jgi:hypothetical protein